MTSRVIAHSVDIYDYEEYIMETVNNNFLMALLLSTEN